MQDIYKYIGAAKKVWELPSYCILTSKKKNI